MRWPSEACAWNRPLTIAGQGRAARGGGRRDEAAPQQPVLQQLRQPGGIAHVGLAAGQDLDVAGVAPQQLQARLLQHLPDRLPAAGRWLHHHLDAPSPASQAASAPAPRQGLEGPHLLGASAMPVRDTDAGHHLVVGDIQPGAARYQQLHRRHLPSAVGWAPGGAYRSGDAETRAHSNSSWCREGPASGLATGSLAARKAELGRAPPILIPRGPRRAARGPSGRGAGPSWCGRRTSGSR